MSDDTDKDVRLCNDAIEAIEAALSAPEPEPARQPDGHIYRYRSPLGGVHESVRDGYHNGSPPFEVVPYWLAAPQPAPAASDAKLRELRDWGDEQFGIDTKWTVPSLIAAQSAWRQVRDGIDEVLAAPPPQAVAPEFAASELRRLRAWIGLIGRAMLAEAEKQSGQQLPPPPSHPEEPSGQGTGGAADLSTSKD